MITPGLCAIFEDIFGRDADSSLVRVSPLVINAIKKDVRALLDARMNDYANPETVAIMKRLRKWVDR